MKKSKRKNQIHGVSEKVLAAQERNRREQEERVRNAIRNNLLARILMQFPLLLNAWQYGILGGGRKDRFVILPIEIADKKFKNYLKLPIGKLVKAYDNVFKAGVLDIFNNCQKRRFEQNCIAVNELQGKMDNVIYTQLRDCTAYNSLKYQVALLMHFLFDWQKINEHESDKEYPKEIDEFLSLLVCFVNQLFKKDSIQEQRQLSACYWLLWEDFMGRKLSEHPNKYENLCIPDIDDTCINYKHRAKDSPPLVLYRENHFAENNQIYEEEKKLAIKQLLAKGIVSLDEAVYSHPRQRVDLRAVV